MASSHDVVKNPYAKSVIRIKARQLCRRADFSLSDLEDLRQEMWLYLVQKVHLYDSSRGTCLETFIAQAIDSCVAMILRDRQREKRRPALYATSLEGTILQGEEDTTSLAGHIQHADQARRTGNSGRDPIADLELREAVTVAMKQLPPASRLLLEQRKTRSQEAVARAHDMSRRQLAKAIKRSRPVFENAGLGKR